MLAKSVPHCDQRGHVEVGVSRWLETAFSALLLLLSVAFGTAFVFIATTRTPTALEAALLQMFSLVAGLAGSFLFGRQSAQGAAREMIKPHARSAFRRVFSLYRGLSRLASAIDAAELAPAPGASASSSGSPALAVLKAIALEQIATADDALEDWNDLVPEEVAELRERAREKAASDRGGLLDG
jgi:hypothetical protein